MSIIGMRTTGFKCRMILGQNPTTTSAIVKRLLMDQGVEFEPGDVVVVDVKLKPRERVRKGRKS